MAENVFQIIDPGPLTTIQDRGRFGFRKYGIPVSGALDSFSSLVANRLVGNSDDAPVLEMTFKGPTMSALADCMIAVTGAQMALRVNGDKRPLWTSICVKKGDVVQVATAAKGMRGYLAVRGGIFRRPVMGSCSTYIAARLGGIEGRSLDGGDFIQALRCPTHPVSFTLDEEFRPNLGDTVSLKAIAGPQDDYFVGNAETLFSSEYISSARSDRMGCRLTGPKVTFRDHSKVTIISEPSLSGCIQIPPDGQPIILLVEQTVGGYAKIATIISPDIDKVAQLRPGDRVMFAESTLADAEHFRTDRLNRLRSIRPVKM